MKKFKSLLPFDVSEDEKLMTVIINSQDQKILHSFISKNTEKFVCLETRLYDVKEYEEYKKNDNYFLSNGIKVNKFQSLEENGIKESNIITLCKNESLE